MARRLLLVVALILSTLLLIARAVPSAASPLEARGDEEPGIVEDSGVDGTDGDDLDVLERRQTCTLVYNYAVRRRLCTKATAPTSYVDISSSNGLFAFILSDGRPRIMQSGVRLPRWNSSLAQIKPNGCVAFNTRFVPDINYNCLSQLWLTIKVQNGLNRPNYYIITNTGVVRFMKNGLATPVLTINPVTGPNPRSAWNFLFKVIRTTSGRPTRTSTRTTTKTFTTKYLTPTALPARDPLLQPFAHYSIWNLPIGDLAQTVPFGMTPPKFWGYDTDFLFLNSRATITPLYPNNDGWTGKDRCTLASSTPLVRVPMAANFKGKPARADYQPNNSAAFIGADNMTVIQGQPLTRCTDTGPITMGGLYTATNVSILGGGRGGAHGGSRLSTMGGVLRVHEFRPWTYPNFPRHALKTFIDARRYYYKNDAITYRWPATTGEAFSDRRGTNPYVKSGCLLVLPKTFDPERQLLSNPGKMLANTLRAYGMYVDDDAARDATGVNVEASYGLSPSIPATGFGNDPGAWQERQAPRDFIANFELEFGYWGHSFPNTQNCTIYSPIYKPVSRNFCMDIMKILDNLHVVVNWDAKAYWNLITNPDNYNKVGVGGGKPLSPWASKLPDDPWLKPCLDRGTATCRARGLTESLVKDSPWQNCLFETQLGCYLQ